MSKVIQIVDSTLREGLQAPGISLSASQTCQIAVQLAAVGIDQLECGHPAASEHEMDRVKAVVALNLGIPVIAHSRARRSDIEAVQRTGAQWVGIFLGVNTYTCTARIPNVSIPILHEMIYDSVAYAKELGLSARYTVEDASRTPIKEVIKAFGLAIDAGADRICVADTVGVMEPHEVAEVVKTLRNEFPYTPLELHLHDDRGLSMANALSGITAGATWISTSVNGIGERAGITDLCALLANLEFKGIRRLGNLGESVLHLSRLVQALTRCGHDERRPVTGKNSFTHTAQLHTNAVLRSEMSYSWINPTMLGLKTKLG